VVFLVFIIEVFCGAQAPLGTGGLFYLVLLMGAVFAGA
jgi:hypothetical protein